MCDLQVDKIKALHALIPDYTEKDVHYSYLMKCYGTNAHANPLRLYMQTHQLLAGGGGGKGHAAAFSR